MNAVALCPVEALHALPEGRSRGFDPSGAGRDTVFVVRRDGLHAWRDACPHIDGAPMAWRKDAYLSGDGRYIACHAHGALFDIASGICVLGPCLGHRLDGVALVVRADGMVVIPAKDIP